MTEIGASQASGFTIDPVARPRFATYVAPRKWMADGRLTRKRLVKDVVALTSLFTRERVTRIELALSAWEADRRGSRDLRRRAKPQVGVGSRYPSSTMRVAP